MPKHYFCSIRAALHRRKLILIGVCLALVWMVILAPERLFAAVIANPTSAPSIIDIHVNENVIAAGDIVCTGIYDIPYTTPPVGTNASQTFIIRLMDPTGTTDLGSTVPYNYTTYEYGYDWGAFSLYFAAGNSLVWGTSYIIQIRVSQEMKVDILKWRHERIGATEPVTHVAIYLNIWRCERGRSWNFALPSNGPCPRR